MLDDIQNTPGPHGLSIDRVGIKDLKIPLVVRDKAAGRQATVATLEMGVHLPAAFKGTHMSRFVEALETWHTGHSNSQILDYATMKRLLEDLMERLHAQKARVRFAFPYFIHKSAPVTGIPAPVAYDCAFTGEKTAEDPKTRFILEVDVPVTTVCPCSKAISRHGAHSQRTIVRIQVHMDKFVWLEDFIEVAESSASAPVYSLLKREDEKYVTEQAYENPCFVEDVVRNVAVRLNGMEHVRWFRVEVESYESIHCHSAFACIERTRQV